MRPLIAAWETPSARAARLKLPSRTIRSKATSWFRSIGPLIELLSENPIDMFAITWLDYSLGSAKLLVQASRHPAAWHAWRGDHRSLPEGAMLDFDRYTHLMFDCYGTLIDWERGIVTALRPVLERHGVAQTNDQILELFGELEAAAEGGPYLRYREVLATVLDGIGTRLSFTPSPEEREEFAGSVVQWPPFPDTVAALHALAQRYRLVILSNVDDDLFAGSARQLATDFAAVFTAQQIGSYKPDRGNFRFAIERLAIPPERILHVAQSLFHDIVPA